uniref:Uncharacterized protein n=1 Tax=Brassica campestris TaxID=3711 RepID=M4DV15_BRACM
MISKYHVQKFIARSRRLTSQVELEMRYPGVKHFAWCKMASSVPLLIWNLLLLGPYALFRVSVNGKRRPRHQRFTVFHHNINNKLVSTESAASWTACSVREWMWCTKMEADGNQSGTPKSKVVSFLCNSTRGAFSSLSSIDHATFSA